MYKPTLPLYALLILSACSQPPERSFSESDIVSATTEQAITQDSSLLNSQTTTQDEQAHLADKQFIVNVKVHFGTTDVVKTAKTLEDLTLSTGGYLQKVQIFNESTDKHSYPIGDGKIKTLTHFVRQGQMTVRIPKERVNEFLNSVQEQVVFLHEQEYTAKDVALDLQRELLHAQIEAQKQADLARLNPTKADDLADKSAHIDSIAQSKYRQALAELDKKALSEQVAFSTISLNFYQNPQIFEQTMPDTNAYISKDNRANFGYRFSQSLYTGWGYFLDFLLWLSSLWAFLLGSVAFILFYKGFRKWRKGDLRLKSHSNKTVNDNDKK